MTSGAVQASLWRDPRFVRCWTSSAVSQFGDRVSEVAVPLIAGGALATAFGLRATLVTVAVGGVLSVLWLLPSPIPGIRSLETGPWHGAAERPSPTRESGPPGRPVRTD